ncbi:protein kinase family protein, partial [Candidatus Desantisbacteria bacterium]|nr:protein kinase family protein [Candidatus Desantisbacteria bacterium]
MKDVKKTKDQYVGIKPVADYIIKKYVGEGKIGKVYKTERKNPPDIFACKIIPKDKLKPGWEKELEKVAQLRGIDHVVQYHSHGESKDHNNITFIYVLFDYIPGINLKEYLNSQKLFLDMAFIENIAKDILDVLYACKAVGILHGDLHEGNILIRDPDVRVPGSPRTIWISDFGYGGSHNNIEPKNDYRQFFSIISNLLHYLDPARLDPRDKIMHQKMNEFLQKRIMESDTMQGRHVENLELLLKEFSIISKLAQREADAA